MSDIEHREIQLRDLRLHLVAAGPRDGELVVLLHGFPEFWYGWRSQIAPLAEAGYRVWAPDQRGYNLSDKPRRISAYGLDRLSRDVADLLEASGGRRAWLVGHDWGGAVAWWAAARWPERFRGLVILNVPHPLVMRRHVLSNPRQRKRSWYFFFYQLPWVPEAWLRRRSWEVAVRAVRGTARPGTFSGEDMERYREAWSRPGAIRSMVHWYRAALRHPPKKLESARIEVPTLILWGEKDRFLGSELVEPSSALCDEAEVHLFPAATHWLQHEEPTEVNRRLLGFLGGGEGG